MVYDLYIGDRTFSSWSLRGWLMMEKFDNPFRTHLVGLYSGTMAADLAALEPARLVPAMKTPDGIVVGESLAMAETLAERHPHKPLWPVDPAQRARARWLCAEMASGFCVLRAACPMQLQHVNEGFAASREVQKDLDRIEQIWSDARRISGAQSGWLFGRYSLADVFYAPVAARIIGYGLPVSAQSQAYCQSVIRDPAFRAWRAEGLKTTYDPFPYPMNAATKGWPT